jgi:hypothetical protein
MMSYLTVSWKFHTFHLNVPKLLEVVTERMAIALGVHFSYYSWFLCGFLFSFIKAKHFKALVFFSSTLSFKLILIN